MLLDGYAAMYGLKRDTVLRIVEDVKILREMAYSANEHGRKKESRP